MISRLSSLRLKQYPGYELVATAPQKIEHKQMKLNSNVTIMMPLICSTCKLYIQIHQVKQQIILIDYMTDAEFENICRLGQGTYGEVFKVRRRCDGRQYALKRVKLMNLKEKDKRNTLNEVRILASVDHPNIIQYREAIFDENKGELALIMEVAHGGDLADKIKTRFQRGETFSQSQIWRWGAGILEGLRYLHSMGVVHRDIKPANILFTLQGVPLIGDLNVARELTRGLAHSQTGTPNYASPQIWDNLSYGAQCDIWSFGCILYQLCCFRPPFRSKNMDELYQRVKNCKFDAIPCRYTLALQNMIKKCLQKKQQRISIEELVKIFAKHSTNHSLKRSQSVGTLLKNIDIPFNIKEISTVLPSSRYNKKIDIPLNPQDQRHNKYANILDQFMKEKATILPKQNKLNYKAYTDQGESLRVCRSQVAIGDRQKNRKDNQKQKRQEQLKLVSFKSVLESLQNAKIDHRSKIGLRKRNIRYGLKLF